ncbi:hypothetical protein AA103196_3094 [Ameyamaea chiangmaiensis NBRC 103196]|uniref:Uncharacterized protein n=1 Tax=Ameyamaea chiangmaiensis TaxID=442969 RepID=A0A850P3U2_9PROT|nr:hypothetical protein [Ameyamaea chiangmaiensis]MBS4074579.1 hypothetical protein [Ameyamaea chiangmaiensis]NVN39335.1 hypothetical protein [Ameyamaea chiangmaiensis]GBQ72552.1 hypothetical protein AA103196_3094 [Ameyamaea chiangmaiensis NBRC 103196]
MAPDPRIEEHERRISNLETATSEIRAGQRDLSDKMMIMHGENRARADANEKKIAAGFSTLEAKVDGIGNLRGWVKWVLVITSCSGFASLINHLSGAAP